MGAGTGAGQRVNSTAGRVANGVAGINEVMVQGRVSSTGEERVLPSGDAVLALRVVVPRGGPLRSTTSATVDVIEVACWSATTRRRARSLAEGDVVQISGALRRRFFRVGAVVQSRYEVEARTVRRVSGTRTTAP